jgi:hypothetical protein
MPPKKQRKQLKLEEMPRRSSRRAAKADAEAPEKPAPSRKRRAEEEPAEARKAAQMKRRRKPQKSSTAAEKEPTPSSSSTRNKKPATTQAAGPGKKAEQAELSTAAPGTLDAPIVINRAPVLELWSACVAHFLHPDLSWAACLAIGTSIATMTAIAKGRSIGTMGPSDPAATRKEGSEKRGTGGGVVRVMGFPMEVMGDAVVVKGKPKEGKESGLAKKFGEGNLEKVREAMEGALVTWQGQKEELDGKAFHMYEKFRPDVGKGQKGWGRKGELHLSKIESVVRK